MDSVGFFVLTMEEGQGTESGNGIGVVERQAGCGQVRREYERKRKRRRRSQTFLLVNSFCQQKFCVGSLFFLFHLEWGQDGN